MTGLDLSHLSGQYAAAAIRSYPRRFREAILGGTAPEAEFLASVIGPGGHSALELVVQTTNTLALLGRALHEVTISEDVTLHGAVLDHTLREWPVPDGTTLESALELLREEATAFAEAVDKVRGKEWSRKARVAGGGSCSALDLAKEAVGSGAANLTATETTITAVGGQ